MSNRAKTPLIWLFALLVGLFLGFVITDTALSMELRPIEEYKAELDRQNPKATIHEIKIVSGSELLAYMNAEPNKMYVVVAFETCIENSSSRMFGVYATAILPDGTIGLSGQLTVVAMEPDSTCAPKLGV